MNTTATVNKKKEGTALKKSETASGDKAIKESSQSESQWMQEIIRRKKLESVFLFITSQCNSKCRTCFYHDKLNSKDDLTVEQIKRISETSPKFDKLWLSGGNPFSEKR